MTIKIGIIGITGYTGEELLKMLSKHPNAELTVLSGRSAEGGTKSVKDIYPHLSHIDVAYENLRPSEVAKRADVIFLALPHKVSFEVMPDLMKSGKKVIDLSADFRLDEVETYEEWYGVKHTAGEFLSEAVYGLPELYREKIKKARLVANPGCYPTTIILGSAPAIKNGLVDITSLIIDSKSGISGAGRKPTEEYFKNEHPNLRPYKLAGEHRHIPETEQELSKLAGEKIVVTFTPHIIPFERGMISSIYMNLKKKTDTAAMIKLYKEFYKNEPFVRVYDEDQIPDIKKITGTNFCDIAVRVDARTNRLIVISALDNLVKGAAGQAVQNMNIMCGLKETEGLFYGNGVL